MTRIPCWRRTISWISAREPESTAEKWWLWEMPQEIMQNPDSITGQYLSRQTEDSGSEGTEKAHRLAENPGSLPE